MGFGDWDLGPTLRWDDKKDLEDWIGFFGIGFFGIGFFGLIWRLGF